MSIASEIQRLQGVKSDILEAIAEKGVTVPAGSALADCPALIGSIGGGGGGGDYPTQEGTFCMCHMGYTYNYATLVENTIPAYEMAVKNGYKIVEADIRHTSDGVPVLLHDADVQVNENNSQTVTVASVTYGTLKNYTYYRTMQKINSLEELIDFCKANDIICYINIKDGTDAQLAADYNMVRSKGMEKSVVWISSTLHHLELIKSIDRYATLDYVVGSSNFSGTIIADAASLKNDVNHVGIEIRYDLLTQSHVDSATQSGLEVLAWTVNDPGVVLDLHSMGVDKIITDYLRSDVIVNSLIVLTKDDLTNCGWKIGAPGLVNYNVTNRATYIGYDLRAKSGKKYLIRVHANPNNSKTLRYSLQLFSGKTYNALVNGTEESLPDNSEMRTGYGWKVSPLEIVLNPQSFMGRIGNQPLYFWITFAFTDDSDFTRDAVSKVEIAEIAELNMINCDANLL